MALSIIGRFNVPAGSSVYGPAQDLEDYDTIYFVMADAANSNHLSLHKFTWPNTLVVVADIHTHLSGKQYDTATIAKDVSLTMGELSADQHYCIVATDYSTQGISVTVLVDVNLATGGITTYTPGAALGSAGPFQPWSGSRRTWAAYTETGTYFFTTLWGNGQHRWIRKRLGMNAGDVDTGNNNAPAMIYWTDIYGFYGTGNDWRFETISLTTSPAQARGMYQNSEVFGIYTKTFWPQPGNNNFPMFQKAWDDDWQYGFGKGTYAALDGDYDILFYRKNIVTLQYQVGVMLAGAGQTSQGGTTNAFDIWQTGTDVSKRRVFFSYGGGGNGKVFTSLAWPPGVDGQVTVDSGGTPIVVGIHTHDEYIYVLHWGGTEQGTCITKLLETELIAGEAEPSIGGIGARILFKDKRVFFIGVPDYGKYLWWGQPLEPQALDVGWDGFNTTVFDDEDNTSINVLDDNLYVGSQKGFIRLRGKSPDSWVLDQTLATTGPLSDKTSSVTPFGLIYPRENGLWLFNGFTSVLFFEKGKNLLNNVNWDEYARAFSLWDGRYYRLYYPSGAATENDRELVIDLIGGIKNARGTEGDRAATFGFSDLTTNTVYLGDASGNLMTLGGTAAQRSFSLMTKEYPTNGLLAAGSFSALHYDIDLAGATLSIIPICDGVEKPAKTITNTTRTRSKVSLPDGNFYRVGFRFEITTDKAVKFYDPWYIV